MAKFGSISAALIGAAAGAGSTAWIAGRTSQSDKSCTRENGEASGSAPDDAVESPLLSEQTELVLQNLGVAVVFLGPNDEVLTATEQAVRLGLVRNDELSVRRIRELVHQVRETGVPIRQDFTITNQLGVAARELNLRITKLERDCCLMVADDQTAQLRVDKTRRDFVANVSHELKTPIGALHVLAEATQEASDDPVAVKRFTSRMLIESVRLAELVGQLIELSRVESRGAKSKSIAIETVIRGAVDECSDQARTRDVEITTDLVGGLIVLGGNKQLASAVRNLIQNAINYSEPGSVVSVTSAATTVDELPFVEIQVVDHGIGISEEDQERIFERFYRSDYSRSRDDGGSGLGLSIVKHIALAHGGLVNVTSTLGEGSTFTLLLPVLEEA